MNHEFEIVGFANEGEEVRRQYPGRWILDESTQGGAEPSLVIEDGPVEDEPVVPRVGEHQTEGILSSSTSEFDNSKHIRAARFGNVLGARCYVQCEEHIQGE
ncbi:MAG TPA: hypothetical protein VKG25_26580 [Bryobacteraceae bacterium]|nr:hypothetical protein [Bryobacteraceae bacterium]